MSRAERDLPIAAALSAEMQARAKRIEAAREANGGMTGYPPGMLQDDCRGLSKALANAPHARQHVKEVCAAIARATGATP